jgi:hypothetical protein
MAHLAPAAIRRAIFEELPALQSRRSKNPEENAGLVPLENTQGQFR